MTLSNNKVMLVLGFEDERKEVLEDIIKKDSLPPYVAIDKSMGKMTINDILNGLKLHTYEKLLPQEEVILFNNLSDIELDKAIKAIRTQMNPKPILAVVTPTSINWTVEYLVEHLIEERQWFRTHGK